jgi:hypothetical protein
VDWVDDWAELLDLALEHDVDKLEQQIGGIGGVREKVTCPESEVVLEQLTCLGIDGLAS